MALSVYVHIPYCLQRCRYCDFTTFEQSEIMPPEQYVKWVLEEIRNRHTFWPDRELATLYFGGGTPSLLPPEFILAICQELAIVGFKFNADCEITIEINPATLTEEKLNIYRRAGFNRFSVGAQTFNDRLLKICGRKHNAADTRGTLRLLQTHNLNYSFDLLFALPGQTFAELEQDLVEVLQWSPPHLSAYCLTVPDSHPMSLGRPPEDEQVAMFDLIEQKLSAIGLVKYEISNFAKRGFASRHNMSYWQDASYWGLGLSSHSYNPAFKPFGLRFWNPKSLPEYGVQAEMRGVESFFALLPQTQSEALQEHEALTDFSHMFLRTSSGLPEAALRKKFQASPRFAEILRRLESLCAVGLLTYTDGAWRLTARGQLISNQVFEQLTFLVNESSPLPPQNPIDFI